MGTRTRFDDELAIMRALVELKRRGVALAEMEMEIARMGPVDLDLLVEVMERVRSRSHRWLLPAAAPAEAGRRA